MESKAGTAAVARILPDKRADRAKPSLGCSKAQLLVERSVDKGHLSSDAMVRVKMVNDRKEKVKEIVAKIEDTQEMRKHLTGMKGRTASHVKDKSRGKEEDKRWPWSR